MKRYAAFLRGVSPMNAKMPELRRAFELAGFARVVTVLSSGNVVFTVEASRESAIERVAEEALQEHLGRAFPTIVRSIATLRRLLGTDPYAPFRLEPGAKRVVTFLRRVPRTPIELPVERDGARILAREGREVFTAYVPSGRGGDFMTLIEKTFGKDVTTRTWDTVTRVAWHEPK